VAGMNLTRTPERQMYSYKGGEYVIEEDKTEQKKTSKPCDYFMTEEQKLRGEYYLEEYRLRKAEVDKYYEEWYEIEKLYACNRDPVASDPSFPLSFIPLITPVVEGQVASMMESGVEYTHVTDVPSHQPMMLKLDAASDYIRRKQRAPQFFKDYARYYDLLGNCWLSISWEKDFSKSKTKPSGFPRLNVPPLRTVFADGRIKDYKDLQYSEYIIQEIGFVPIYWARKEYGDEKAEAISSGSYEYQGSNPDTSYDDSKSFTLLHVWTRTNEEGNLQLIEMDTNGFILRESDSSKPYYEGVDNEYPFWFGRMIPQLGQFYGFGDGKILKPMQETVNNLADELELAARFSAQTKIVVDPKAKMDVDQLDSDPSTFAIAENPHQNILQLQAGGVNPVVQSMIEFLLREAQRVVRFSDVMTGQAQAASSTATAINSQLVQGSVGIKDKKSDISQAMEWADRYSLKLCLKKWSKPFWAKLATDYSEFIDPQMIGTAPAAMPTSSKTVEKILNLPNLDPSKIPAFEEVRDKNGNIVMQDIDFDVRVVLGNGIPKGRTDMYNILLGLAQMQVMDENGQVKPLITAKRLKEMMEQTLGMKLTTSGEEFAAKQAQIIPPTAINPVGQGGAVQVPTGVAENLMGTVPQMPNMDSRKVQI